MEDESNACQSFYGTIEWLSQHIWVLKQEADRVQRIIDAMEQIPSSSTDELMLYTGIRRGWILPSANVSRKLNGTKFTE